MASTCSQTTVTTLASRLVLSIRNTVMDRIVSYRIDLPSRSRLGTDGSRTIGVDAKSH